MFSIIFSYAYLSSIYLFWWSVYSVFCPCSNKTVFLLQFESILYVLDTTWHILDTLHILDSALWICGMQVVSDVGYFFIFWTESFPKQTFLILMKPNLLFFPLWIMLFWIMLFWSNLSIICLVICPEDFLIYFPQSFIVLFKSIIYLGLIETSISGLLVFWLSNAYWCSSIIYREAISSLC